jgi:PAS domain S-box-containing protein
MNHIEGGNRLVVILRNMPLRYRLSFAFLFLALFGTVTLVGLAIVSQKELIGQAEHERLNGYSHAFDHNLELQGRWAVSLASSFARNPEVADALARRDRKRLIELCYSSYLFMKEHYGISQFNFHIIPPANFLRLQRPYEFGDDLWYRQTIADAMAKKKETFGLEEGLTGYGIRGVAPVFQDGKIIGTIEIGFSFGTVFLEEMKKQFQIEASILSPDEGRTSFHSLASTFLQPFERTDSVYGDVFRNGSPRLLMRHISGAPYVLLVRPVRDYKGNTVVLVEFGVSRAKTLAVIDHYWYLMLGSGILALIFSIAAIYILSVFFTRHIGKMVAFAREIALGGQVRPLDIHPSGELAVLAEALNEMLASLEESRKEIRNHTVNLERMVHVRTQALTESEKKYRTLVETVPLVVYQLLGNGKMVFANHFIEELTGAPLDKILSNAEFWREKVCEEDRSRVWPLMDRCLKEGARFEAEYKICLPRGSAIYVLDHAFPVLDEDGDVEMVNGFMVDVTDRYCLQQQIIQTEELRTLNEISARLSHEIRNPLAAAGGFARRLAQKLPEDDPNRKNAVIVVEEVARLEKILEKTLDCLRPFEVVMERVSLNEVIKDVLERQKEAFNGRTSGFEPGLSPYLPEVALDRVLFGRALESILLALLDYCRAETRIEVKTYCGENTVHLEMTGQGEGLCEDDIEHFFYPFRFHPKSSELLELPMAKMVIHKHQGLIRLRRKGTDQLVLDISLPVQGAGFRQKVQPRVFEMEKKKVEPPPDSDSTHTLP